MAGKGGKKGGKASEKGGDRGAKGGSKGGSKGAQDGGKGGAASARLASKPYKAAIDEVLETTTVRPADFDQKAIQLLDYLQKHGGRAPDALKYLKDVATGVGRDDILNSRAYVYALLRKFDEQAYHDMKAETGGEKAPGDRERPSKDAGSGGGDASSRAPGDASSRQPPAPPPLQDYLAQVGIFGGKPPPPPPAHEALDLNPEAPEFNPGANWSGRLVGATPTAPAPAAAAPPPPYPYGFYPGAAYPGSPYAQPSPYGGYPYPAGYPQPGYPQGYPQYPAACGGGMPPPPAADGGKKGGKGGRRKGEGKGDKGGKGGDKQEGHAAKADAGGDKAPAVPAGGMPPVESVGSKGHAEQKCKPCAFYHTKGCASGANCQFCHLCGPGEKKKRKKDTGSKDDAKEDGAQADAAPAAVEAR